MESYVLNICGRDHGCLLKNKSFVPLYGPILSITNSSSHENKTISFVHSAWNTSGNSIAAGDCQGNLFMFELHKNRFWLIHRLSCCITFLTFTNDPEQDIVAALSDCSIVSINSESKLIKNRFTQHKSCVTHISFDKSGRRALSCSLDQAIMWELDTFHVLRVLTLKKTVDIVKVFFIPQKDIIVSAFKDSSVFLWDSERFSCTCQFVCKSGTTLLNVRAVDSSSDGKLLVCAGKADWFYVWSIENGRMLYTVLLPKKVTFVKQINFSSFIESLEDYVLFLLSQDGHIHIYNLKRMEHLFELAYNEEKITSYGISTKCFKLNTITIQGNLKLFDLENILQEAAEPVTQKAEKTTPSFQKSKPQPQSRKMTLKKEPSDVDKKRLTSVIKNFGEYPEKHRVFIWTRLLDLPFNEAAFNVLYQESLNVSFFDKDYPITNPGVKKTFIRIMSMLVRWCPVLQEMEYFQSLAYPFIKVLHKNALICFELLITFISNWCQNWFIYCPFPPFNILCVVENIIAIHDRKLILHFIQQDVTPEVYAWPLLHTAFSEVFNKKQWLKLWDNIFSNSIPFLLYVVAAFSIVSREELFCCYSLNQFKACYQRHGISVSDVLKKAYDLQRTTPEHADPALVVGAFSPIPAGTYPVFLEMAHMELDLENVTKQEAIEQEVNYIKRKEVEMKLAKNYLIELQELQMLRRKLLVESIELKADSLVTLNTKLKKVQHLIQDSLTNQVSMFQGEATEEQFPVVDKMVARTHVFHFKDYMNRLKKMK